MDGNKIYNKKFFLFSLRILNNYQENNNNT